MISDMERYYCKSCKQLFNDDIHKPYYTYNNFIDNQAHLIFEGEYTRGMVQPNYHSQCPHCHSKHTLNVDEILSGKIVCKSEKLHESDDNIMLKCLGEWLKFYNEITGYYIDRNILYTDGKRLKRKIKQLLGRK